MLNRFVVQTRNLSWLLVFLTVNSRLTTITSIVTMAIIVMIVMVIITMVVLMIVIMTRMGLQRFASLFLFAPLSCKRWQDWTKQSNQKVI